MLEIGSTEKLQDTTYYESFMQGYCGYMKAEELSFSENPELMSALSEIYLLAKKKGMEYASSGLNKSDAAGYGLNDGWSAAQMAHTGKESFYSIGSSSSTDLKDEFFFDEGESDLPLEDEEGETADELNDFEFSESASDTWETGETWDYESDEYTDELNEDTENSDEQKAGVTRDYIRGFIAGYSDYLYEYGISLKDNEALKSSLRVSFLRALDPDDDMFNPVRGEDKTSFYPGMMDGRRCAELDIERNSISSALNSDEDDESRVKESDLLYYV